ncbi:MAG: YqaA family protein [Alphaproteobacteria bacterium]|jgi:membrane protein YqaA with SNARE-associated domain|nr:YqaA family protein [Alphaproteobacteria bacterium]MDP6830755.1 YqaA family protein [Alphaproteobacteria bacterium]MDP6872777.1 YqaA family protein [Alphaproteobacteria bacterium]
MLRWLYDRTMALAGHRHANWALGAVSFVESSVFPIPPDVMLIPMVLAQRHKALLIALICTVASVLGGLLGYAIGAYLFDALGKPILDFYGYGEKFASFQGRYNEWGVWIVLIAGLTPFPYKVITIASGVTGLSLPVFLIASVVARGLRFAIVTALLWYFGAPIRDFIERYLGLLFTLFMVLLIGGFAVVKLVL